MLENLDPDTRANLAAPARAGGADSSEYVFHPTLTLGGNYRPLTVEQIEKAVMAGVYLQIGPDADIDLARWSHFSEHIRGLYVAGDGRRIAALNSISSWWSLRSLVAQGVRSAVDLSALPRLEQAYVSRALSSSAARNPHVKYLSIAGPTEGMSLNAALIRLAIESPRVDLNMISDLSRLEHLGISTRGAVDLAPLSRARALKSMDIRCNRLVGVETLGDLRALTRLSLESVREAPGSESLAELNLTFFEADPNYIFDEEFRARVSTKAGHWYLGRRRKQD